MASPHPLATQAGLDMLLRGGTALDAAVAAGAALAVVYPHMTGLGGDSFWLWWDARAGRLQGLQACGAAAGLASPALYRRHGLAEIPARGPLAALTVPGAVDGLWEAHRYSRVRLGSPLSWEDLLAPAIEHAAGGVAVAPCLARVTGRAGDLLGRAGEAPFRLLRDTYLVEADGRARAPEPGAVLRQPAVARTLERLARSGGRDFYEGQVAADLARAAEAAGSPLRVADLARHRSRFVEPIRIAYRGLQAVSVPPPCQGLVALMVLGMLDAAGLEEAPDGSAEHIHRVVEATKLAFADRDRWLADPEAVPVPLDRLLDRAYLAGRARGLGRARARAGPGSPGRPGGDTVAVVAVDEAGHAVSLIQSLYHEWGSGVVAGDTGVVLQNRGAFFSLDPGHANVLAPGKRPAHTLTPFMLLREDAPWVAAGTMGGEGQPQTLVALTMRLHDFGLDPQAAVEAPRWLFGRTWGEARRDLSLEGRVDPAVVEALRARGHPVRVVEPWSDTMGHAQVVRREPDGLLVGGGDPRADGPAMGA